MPRSSIQRYDHALLDLFRRHARRLHDDLHLGRRDIREGVDGKFHESVSAAARNQRGENQNQQTLGEREFDQSLQHRLIPAPPEP
jgi:hypothetical protein